MTVVSCDNVVRNILSTKTNLSNFNKHKDSMLCSVIHHAVYGCRSMPRGTRRVRRRRCTVGYCNKDSPGEQLVQFHFQLIYVRRRPQVSSFAPSSLHVSIPRVGEV